MKRTLIPAFGLGLSVAATHGIGRFGYALLLPPMREALKWSYLQASWMNTANAMGYMAGALIGYWLLGKARTTSLFTVGLLMTAVSVSLTGLGGPYSWLFVTRLLAGVGTAWAFSCGGALITFRYAHLPEIRGYATGLFFGGAGLGMALAALVIPALIERLGSSGWRAGWLIMGALCAALSVWPLLLLRIRVDERGPRATTESSASAGSRATQLAYFVFAIAHTGYMFFVFAWLRSSQADWRLGAAMWIALGISVLVSALVWQRALARWPASRTIGLSCFVLAVGSALPLISLSVTSVLLSAILVGSSIFIVPAATTVLVRQELSPSAWPRATMYFTILFAVGQAVGSWVTGWLADTFSLPLSLGGGSVGLLLSALLAGYGRMLERTRVAHRRDVG